MVVHLVQEVVWVQQAVQEELVLAVRAEATLLVAVVVVLSSATAVAVHHPALAHLVLAVPFSHLLAQVAALQPSQAVQEQNSSQAVLVVLAPSLAWVVQEELALHLAEAVLS